MPRKDPLRAYGTRKTPQTRRAMPKQRPNNAGGFSFEVTDAERLRRFLILGTDGGTYYVREQELTRANADIVVKMAREQPRLLLDTIVEVSVDGLAPKQQPTLFAFAALMSIAPVNFRREAKEQFNAIVRTGTHLFTFLNYVRQFRGWGRLLRESVAGWYLKKAPEKLAYQMVKYQSREGYTHRDALRLAHPETAEGSVHNALFLWATFDPNATKPKPSKLVRQVLKSDPAKREKLQRMEGDREKRMAVWSRKRDALEGAQSLLPKTVANFERLKAKPEKTLKLLSEPDHGLSWEMLPTEVLNDKEVWKKLLESSSVPLGALVRQLPRLTRIGLLDDRDWLRRVCGMVTDPQAIMNSRIHPISLLMAQKAYASGVSRGDVRWAPIPQLIDGLDGAFHKAFKNIEPTGKRVRLALDVSGSMSCGEMPGGLTPREGSAAMALATARVEDPYSYDIVGFTGGRYGFGYGRRTTSDEMLTKLDISPKQRLRDAVQAVSGLPFGGTDCSLPMAHALEKGQEFDAFVVYTDSETWAGKEHPHQALKRYREHTGIPAKLVVVGMTATEFTIADPDDAGMLDVVGFDASAPSIISDFIRGKEGK